MSSSADNIAHWMRQKLEQDRALYQESVVHDILAKFGKQFVYENENGNLAIGRDVLRAFRKLTENDVVWDRGERAWRFRERFDDPNKRETY